MYVSMTGFSRTQLDTPSGVYTLELSSVNNKYQDIQIRLPKELSGMDFWLTQRLRGAFKRGRLHARVYFTPVSGFVSLSLNKEVLLAYVQDLDKIAAETGRMAPDLGACLSLPGVMKENVNEISENSLLDAEKTLSTLLANGAEQWQQMRLAEGLSLKREIDQHLNALSGAVNQIESHWTHCRDAAFLTLKARVCKMLNTLEENLDQGRLLQEIALITDRFDISEELARFKCHLDKFIESADDCESSGRKLDFIVQEMNRELNTMGSKVADSTIRMLAVEAKTSLERIREQIQNLE